LAPEVRSAACQQEISGQKFFLFLEIFCPAMILYDEKMMSV